MNRRRAVITGLGALTPAGNDVPAMWKTLLSGTSCTERVSLFEQAGLRSQVGAIIHRFDPATVRSRQDVPRLGRLVQFMLAAATEAGRDAGLDGAPIDRARAGVVIGTGVGDAAQTYIQGDVAIRDGASKIRPDYAARVMLNAAPAHVAREYDLRGPNFAVGSACAASGHAAGLALRLIQQGDADLVVTGGVEEMASGCMMQTAFDKVQAITARNQEPKTASRPFDKTRDGFVLGEGAGAMVVEELEHAKRRGARIYAEFAGFGQASDAYHITAPEPNGVGAVAAMNLALADAGRRPDEVQYVNAHGTSTPLNDKMETIACKRVFGDHARRVAISATKSMVGHLIGASAILGLMAAVLAIRDRRVHPTANYREPDPECDLDYVPNVARDVDVNVALANSFGFGGHCVSLCAARLP